MMLQQMTICNIYIYIYIYICQYQGNHVQIGDISLKKYGFLGNGIYYNIWCIVMHMYVYNVQDQYPHACNEHNFYNV